MGEQRDLTINEVAADLRVHRRTVQRLIARGQIPAYRVGPRQYRIKPDDLREFKRQSQVQPSTNEDVEMPLAG